MHRRELDSCVSAFKVIIVLPKCCIQGSDGELSDSILEKRTVRILAIFAINLVVLCVVFSVFLMNFHFSEDTFEAMLRTSALPDTNLRNGRFVHYCFYTALNTLGFNAAEHQALGQLLLTLVIAIITTALAVRFSEGNTGGNLSIRSVVMFDVAALFLFVNPAFLFGWYAWPETAFGASLSLSVAFGSALLVCHSRPGAIRFICSAVLLFIAVGMYQIYIEYYIAIAIAYHLLKSDFNSGRKTVARMSIIVGIAAIASILNIQIMSYMQRTGIIVVDPRSASMSLSTMLGNITAIAAELRSMWGAVYGAPARLFMAACMLAFIFLCIVGIKASGRDLKPSKIILFVICLVGVVAVSFLPNIVSSLLWLAPRTYVGLFGIPLLLVSFVAPYIGSDGVAPIGANVALCACLAISGVCTIDAQASALISNQQDVAEVLTMQREISEWEEKEGEQVKEVYFQYDNSREYHYPNVKYAQYDDNVRGIAYSWCFEYLFEYQSQEKLHPSEMSQNEYEAVFGDDEWSEFDVDEQLVIDDGVAYIALY